MQRLRNPDESTWRCRILPNREVKSAAAGQNSSVILKLGSPAENSQADEELEVDYVFTATGYRRNAHEAMLGEVTNMAVKNQDKFWVERDYSVRFKDGAVANNSGIWLQGCNEGTHGVSFSL
jgi:L-ornithine N5-oxygenase